MNQTMASGRRHVRVIPYLQYNLIQPRPKPRAVRREHGRARLCSHDKRVDFYIHCWHAVIKFWCLSWPEVRAKMHLMLYGGRWRWEWQNPMWLTSTCGWLLQLLLIGSFQSDKNIVLGISLFKFIVLQSVFFFINLQQKFFLSQILVLRLYQGSATFAIEKAILPLIQRNNIYLGLQLLLDVKKRFISFFRFKKKKDGAILSYCMCIPVIGGIPVRGTLLH